MSFDVHGYEFHGHKKRLTVQDCDRLWWIFYRMRKECTEEGNGKMATFFYESCQRSCDKRWQILKSQMGNTPPWRMTSEGYYP